MSEENKHTDDGITISSKNLNIIFGIVILILIAGLIAVLINSEDSESNTDETGNTNEVSSDEASESSDEVEETTEVNNNQSSSEESTDSTESTVASDPTPTPAAPDLQNLTYKTDWDTPTEVKLTDGVWGSGNKVAKFRTSVSAQLDLKGEEDSIAVVSFQNEGTGIFYYAYAIVEGVVSDPYFIGDRISQYSLTDVGSGQVELLFVDQQGTGDSLALAFNGTEITQQ